MEFVIGGLAATSAGVLTNPLEVVNHHMKANQLNGFVKTGLQVVKREGLKSLQKGLSPILGAHLTAYGMKLGTYKFAQNQGITKNSNGDVAVAMSVSASAAGGLVGQYLSTPFNLLKAEHVAHVAEAQDKKVTYTDTVKKIYNQHGMKGFLRGASAAVPKAVIGSSQLTTYTCAKECLYQQHEIFSQNKVLTSMLASVAAGLAYSLSTTPFDHVISKMTAQAINPEKKVYSGYIDCVRKTYKKDGLKPFYRGAGPAVLKHGPHTVVCLTVWEALNATYKQ